MKYFLAALFLFASSATFAQDKKSVAEVNKVEGIRVFVDCTPSLKYEVLGEVKRSFWSGDDYLGFRDELVYKLKKKFPNAEGAIIHFRTQVESSAEAIRFTEN